MLLIVSGADKVPLDYDKYYIAEKYGGIDEIGFTLPRDHPQAPLLAEETVLEDTETGQWYLVKGIDEGVRTISIKGELDTDALKSRMKIGYTNGSATVVDTISGYLPAGWTVEDHAHIAIRRTLELEAATPLEMIEACHNTYGITTRYDTAARVVHIYNPSDNQPTGAYVTDELNLTECQFKGYSTTFATRLYCRGKDGMTFSAINDGKTYVDDHTYTDKVICAYWRDERYTDKANMLADAKRNLAAMAVPQRSYQCSVIDLAKVTEQAEGADDNIYSYQDLGLYNIVTLLDRRRGTRINHMVVEYKRYPHYPADNVVTLSTVAPSISRQVTSVQQQISKPTSDFRQQMQASVAAATETIAGQLGGNYIVTTAPATGKPNGWAIMDTEDAATAQQVWRMTAGGMGHSANGFDGPYDVAITMDGKINASAILTGILTADLIKAGVLSSADGSTALDMASGILETKNGTYSAELWGGALTLKRGDAITLHAYTSAEYPTGVLQTLDADGTVLAQIGGADVKGGRYYLRVNNEDYLLAWVDADGVAKLDVEEVSADSVSADSVSADSIAAKDGFTLYNRQGAAEGRIWMDGNTSSCDFDRLWANQLLHFNGYMARWRDITIDGTTYKVMVAQT